jgi:hypothetical protein
MTSINGVDYHNVCGVSSAQRTFFDVLKTICIDILGKEGKGKRTALRIAKFITVIKHEKIILEGAQQAYSDQKYINDATKNVIHSLIPEKINLANIFFQTEKTPNGMLINTNINFFVLNNIYHKYVPDIHSSISPALILSYILNTEAELYFSSNNNSEIATSNLSSNIISNKINSILNKSIQSSEKIKSFQDFIFNDAKSLSEAINKNLIDLDELIIVLKNSQKFKKWLAGVEPDQNLIKSYYDEVTKKSIIDKLPGKSVRFGFFTGAGLIADSVLTGGFGTAVGIGTGALDSLFLDKLISGWKPNQFIENDVNKLFKK